MCCHAGKVATLHYWDYRQISFHTCDQLYKLDNIKHHRILSPLQLIGKSSARDRKSSTLSSVEKADNNQGNI